jgi:hypothetical protein
MRRAGGQKVHAQKEDKKTRGALSGKMVHSHVLRRSTMKTQKVNGFKGSLTGVIDEKYMLKKWMKRHMCMVRKNNAFVSA